MGGGEAGSGPGRTVREGPGPVAEFPPATPELVPGSALEKAPAISPCICQAPKTYSPVCLPACLPAMELPECPQLSLLPTCPWVFLPAGSPSVVAGVPPTHPPKGQRRSHSGSTGFCTEVKCSFSARVVLLAVWADSSQRPFPKSLV